MAYIIAGKADDPAFARVEYMAKLIEAVCPQIFFRFEMKHPDAWEAFIQHIFRKFDFSGFENDFPGPLVWTLEGSLIGGSAEFIQIICVQKFGLEAPSPTWDVHFKQIAADNFRQVKQQLLREEFGLPLGESAEAARASAEASGTVRPRSFESQRQIVAGTTMEVWVSPGLQERFRAINEEFGDGSSAQLDLGLNVALCGDDQSHAVILHPEPLVKQHLVLLPKSQLVMAPETTQFGIPPHRYRYDEKEDLKLSDFVAAMDLLQNVAGVATWSAFRGACKEYRHPVDTHLQVLAFPLASRDAEESLRHPLEMAIERALKEGRAAVAALRFPHLLAAIGAPLSPDGLPSSANLGKAALHAYEASQANFKCSACSVAFTGTWMLFMPLAIPQTAAQHEAWIALPPPHPSCLCGLVVAPSLRPTYPEAAGDGSHEGQLVSTRAREEGIPEDSPEYEAADKEVRISTRILTAPVELMRLWSAKE